MTSLVAEDTTMIVEPHQIRSNWRMFFPSSTTLLLIIFLIGSLLLNGDVKPLIRRGFFCNDSSLNHPFNKETIDLKLLMLFALVLPGLVIKFCDRRLVRFLVRNLPYLDRSKLTKKRRKVSDEVQDVDLIEEERLIANRESSKRRQFILNEIEADSEKIEYNANQDGDSSKDSFSPVPLNSDDEQINSKTTSRLGLKILGRHFGEFQLFLFGFSTTMLFTGIGKITFGNLRPHFMTRCKPNVDCTKLANSNRYIEEYTCLGENLGSRGLSYITTSWPSGHAAVMFYSMLYLIFYLNHVIPVLVRLSSKKVEKRFEPMVMYALYVLMVSLAGYVALTRVSDYHHHPLDVLSGSVIGSLIAIVITRCISRQYVKPILGD